MAGDPAVQDLFPRELKLFSPLKKKKRKENMEITKPQLSCS